MRYRTLGGTGIEVSVHCLGTMMFGAVGNPDHEDSVRIIHAALDQGINFVDTADMYSRGESEEIVGKALKGRRDDVVLATKVHFPLEDGTRNRSGNSRRWIVQEVENSLRRLDTDWIDLYQVHRPDYSTDLEETLWVLTDLVSQGKIRAFGCSTFPAEDIVQAYHVSERRGYGKFRTEQPPYSLLARGIERSVLPTCQRLGMGVLTWSPLASGFLSGKVRRGEVDLTKGRAALTPLRFDPSIPSNAAKFDALEQLLEVAEGIGCTLPELALAFVTTHPAVTSVISGPRTMEHLDGLLKGADLTLDDATLDRIDEIVPPGTDLYPPDGAWKSPFLTDPALRRRLPADR
jgi:aryl-alcohol dehydrogenase-like predicted oxidoreductase